MKKSFTGIIVIFGASGDLTERKLIPSIFNLTKNNKLIHQKILGVSRQCFNDETFRKKNYKSLLTLYPKEEKEISLFLKNVYYESISYDTKGFIIIKNRLNKINNNIAKNNIIFYLSTPPFLYEIIPFYLSEIGLNSENNGYKRIVIEKPFGINEKSADVLNTSLLKYYKPSQLFRIDHYLAKKIIQKLFDFRINNPIFENIWNKEHIDNVQIYIQESVDVESRVGYYDKMGAIRDMVQNHILQILAMISIDLPKEFNSIHIHNNILKIFNNIVKFKTNDDIQNNVVIGQYTKNIIHGILKKGYRDKKGLEKSITETYVAIRFFINNNRWKNIPFYISTGKRLKKKNSKIIINFKSHTRFNNQLIFDIFPKEEIKLAINNQYFNNGISLIKKEFIVLDNTKNDIGRAYDYEYLMLKIIQGDHTLFVNHEELKTCWNIIDPIINYIKNNNILNFYKSGSLSLDQSDKMLKKLGHIWYYKLFDNV